MNTGRIYYWGADYHLVHDGILLKKDPKDTVIIRWGDGADVAQRLGGKIAETNKKLIDYLWMKGLEPGKDFTIQCSSWQEEGKYCWESYPVFHFGGEH